LHADQLVHADDALLWQGLAVFVLNGQLTVDQIVGIDMFNGQVGAGTENVTIRCIQTTQGEQCAYRHVRCLDGTRKQGRQCDTCSQTMLELVHCVSSW